MSFISNRPKHFEGELCPVCLSKIKNIRNIGRLKLRNGIRGEFLGCSRYPDCKYTHPIWFYNPIKNEFGLDPKRDWYEAANHTLYESYQKKLLE